MDQHLRLTANRRRRVAATAIAAVALAALLLGVAGVAAGDAPTITYTLKPAAVVYGQGVTVAGVVTPATAGQQVAVALDGADVATASTDAGGAFSVTFKPVVSGTVTARLVADGTTGPSLPLAVEPQVTAKPKHGTPWSHGHLTLRVLPAAYHGLVAATVWHDGHQVAKASARVSGGRAVLRIPTRGVGAFSVRYTLQASDGFAERSLRATVKAPWHKLVVGSYGPYVRALLTQLARLHFRIPGISSSLSMSAGDSVVAFQKAYGLPRTYVFDGDDWNKLDHAKLVKARSKTPSLHIEIDKTRQILMVVKGGSPLGIIPVSTGATGNTPEGWFHILWKAPSTTTWLGSAILWRTMDFYGNFAMHGYPEVPPYPASHGCVREPIWVADWTYGLSSVGEAVYVYH